MEGLIKRLINAGARVSYQARRMLKSRNIMLRMHAPPWAVTCIRLLGFFLHCVKKTNENQPPDGDAKAEANNMSG